MSKFKDTFIIIAITLLFFGILELASYFILVFIGHDPFNADQRYQYGKVASCYAVSDNKKNFSFSAHDSINNIVPLVIDNNGFVQGKATLSRIKPSGIIRIFIVGGSTAFGSGQTRSAVPDDSYPESSYSYEASIAGQLLSVLSAKYKDKKFEVINAAVVGHQMSQNHARYYEKIHDFGPDIVINIDGRNDNAVFSDMDTSNGYIPGEVYSAAVGEFDDLINLEVRARSRQWPFTVNLINYMIDRKVIPGEENSKKGNNTDHREPKTKEPELKYYKLYEPILIKNAQKFLWMVDSYERQLKADKVHSVFVLQPLLSRRVNQKMLSPKEIKMRTHLEAFPQMDSMALDTAIDNWLKNTPPKEAAIIRQVLKSGNSLSAVRDGYFYNEYLSQTIDSIVALHGNTYIDFGKEMKDLGSKDEFFTDYCHVTAFGNRYMAEIIVKKIDTVILGL